MDRTNHFIFLIITVILGVTSINTNFVVPIESNVEINNYNFSNIDYLIITSSDFVDAVKPFRQWKLQKGLRTEIKTIEDIALQYEGLTINQKIQNCIESTYGVQWVLLAGGAEAVPTTDVFINDGFPYDGDTVVCDHYYTNYRGDWDYDGGNRWFVKNDPMNWNDSVYIGRFPALSTSQLSIFVNNSINYEKNPPIGNWMNRALLSGAFVCFDEDYNNDSLVDWEDIDGNRFNNWIKNNIIPSNWTTTLLGETEGVFPTDYPYQMSLNEENVLAELQKGAGIGIMYGHGTTTTIFRQIFEEDLDNDGLFDYDQPNIFMNGTVNFNARSLDSYSITSFLDGVNLTSLDKRGFYFFLACSNGNFDLDDNQQCMASSMLEKCAIGTIASSHVSWAEDFWTERDHPGWYNEGLAGRFFEQIFQQGINRPGMAFTMAKIDYTNDMKRRNSSDPVVLVPGFENKVLTQFNLLGDPEIPLWLETPKEFEVIIHYSSIEVRDFEDNPLERARVSLMNDTYYWSGDTFSNGEINLPVPSDEMSSLNLTVYKEGYIPYLKEGEIDVSINKTSENIGIFEVLLILSLINLTFKSKKR
ncbi:MAG: C25 family cysteine peptidase [Candidatus Hodarchaeales archaeon]